MKYAINTFKYIQYDYIFNIKYIKYDYRYIYSNTFKYTQNLSNTFKHIIYTLKEFGIYYKYI